jgi:hypothetical protein
MSDISTLSSEPGWKSWKVTRNASTYLYPSEHTTFKKQNIIYLLCSDLHYFYKFRLLITHHQDKYYELITSCQSSILIYNIHLCVL